MAKKAYDVVAKTGEYTDREGNTKPKWLNVGAVLKTDNGHVLLIDRHFNPAGLPDPENRGTVMLSLFEPKARGESQPAPSEGPSDEIPF